MCFVPGFIARDGWIKRGYTAADGVIYIKYKSVDFLYLGAQEHLYLVNSLMALTLKKPNRKASYSKARLLLNYTGPSNTQMI